MPGLIFRRTLSTAGSVAAANSHCSKRRLVFESSGSAELLHVLMLPDFDRADRIGEFWSYPESRVGRREALVFAGTEAILQDEVDDRERSDHYSDDDDDPDADGSDHPTTLNHHKPRLACAKP